MALFIGFGKVELTNTFILCANLSKKGETNE